MNRLTRSALATLLWSETDDEGTPLDTLGFAASDELVARLDGEVTRFFEAAEAMGFDAVEHRAMMIYHDQGDEWGHAAHDFILTRNRHGAGFWDGDWHEPWGDKLTKLAESFGQLECYIGDDELIYAI